MSFERQVVTHPSIRTPNVDLLAPWKCKASQLCSATLPWLSAGRGGADLHEWWKVDYSLMLLEYVWR